MSSTRDNRARAVTWAVALGTAPVPLDTAVNVAFPHITASFAVPPDAIRWVIISYVLTYASLLLVAGRLADRFGHRRLFVSGLLVNMAGLLGCALADSLGALVVNRMLQGLGAAAVLAAGPALITLSRPESERLSAVGSYTIGFGLAGAAGPLVGGWVIGLADWNGVFWFRLPVALTGLAMTLVWVAPRAEREHRSGSLDVAVALAVVLTLVSGLLALGQIPRSGPAAPVTLSLLALAVAAALAYVARVRARPGSGLFDARLLSNRRFVSLNAAHGLTAMAEFSVMLLVPFYITSRTGLSPLGAGLVMASAPAGIVLASLLIKRLPAHAQPRWLPTVAVVVLAASLEAIALWPARPALGWMLFTLLLAGAGYGLYHVTAMDRVMGTLSERERGVAGSISMLVRTAGVVGAASLTSWWFVSLGGNDPASFGPAFTGSFHASAGLACLGAVLAHLAAHSGNSAADRHAS